MIAIKAAARREFLFPAALPLVIEFFSDFRRVTDFLPYISLVQETAESQQYRVLYSTVELATYQIHIFADVKTELDERQKILYVRPATDFQPVQPKATLRSLTASGSYASRSVFHEAGDQCDVLFEMELSALLPRPLGLRLMPGGILNRIADSITNQRMGEIIEGFIYRSVKAYQAWDPTKKS
jgi:hypothetical protein